MPDPRDLDDVTVLALTIYGEARGEKREGREAVANVILNRVMLRQWSVGPASWGRSVKDVCLARLQFSSWNADDPNRAKMLALGAGEVSNKAYDECMAIAKRAIRSELNDNTGQADHYLVTAIASRTKWAKGKKPVAVIGAHSFYKFYSIPESAPIEPPQSRAEGAAHQDTVASPTVAQPRPLPPEPVLTSPQPATSPQPVAVPPQAGVLSRQPDEPPSEPEAPRNMKPLTKSRTWWLGIATTVLGAIKMGAEIVSDWLSDIYKFAHETYIAHQELILWIWAKASAVDIVKPWHVGAAVMLAGMIFMLLRWDDKRKAAR